MYEYAYICVYLYGLVLMSVILVFITRNMNVLVFIRSQKLKASLFGFGYHKKKKYRNLQQKEQQNLAITNQATTPAHFNFITFMSPVTINTYIHSNMQTQQSAELAII